MRRQSLSFDNLGEVLSSAKNAAKLGQQQFETPVEVAKALMLPLPRIAALAARFLRHEPKMA